jgi:hypothetical protein
LLPRSRLLLRALWLLPGLLRLLRPWLLLGLLTRLLLRVLWNRRMLFLLPGGLGLLCVLGTRLSLLCLLTTRLRCLRPHLRGLAGFRLRLWLRGTLLRRWLLSTLRLLGTLLLRL